MTATVVAADRQTEVLHYTRSLCEALEVDYRLWVTKSHQSSLERSDSLKSLNPDWHKQCLEEIRTGTFDWRFNVTIEEGRKYLKVITSSHGSNSVHCFVDKCTGEVYKSATWKSPAKGVRYNLLDSASRNECYRRADWSGSYLYLR